MWKLNSYILRLYSNFMTKIKKKKKNCPSWHVNSLKLVLSLNFSLLQNISWFNKYLLGYFLYNKVGDRHLGSKLILCPTTVQYNKKRKSAPTPCNSSNKDAWRWREEISNSKKNRMGKRAKRINSLWRNLTNMISVKWSKTTSTVTNPVHNMCFDIIQWK